MSSILAIDVDASNNIRAKDAVAGASMSFISVSRIVAALNAAKYHGSIDRVMNPHNMRCSSVLATFKIDHEAYLSAKGEDDPNAPNNDGRDDERRITHWCSMFKHCLATSYSSRSPLSNVLRECPITPD